MQYAGLSLFDSALKYSFSIQKSYHFFSISLGSYLFSSMLNFISCSSSYIQSKDNFDILTSLISMLLILSK